MAIGKGVGFLGAAGTVRIAGLATLMLAALLALGLANPASAAQATTLSPKELQQILHRATDGYKVVPKSRAFAKVPGVDAMRARVELYPRKMQIKGGVNLRDWLYDGMIAARTLEESAVLAEAARDRRQSELLRLVCLRALRRGRAPVPAKALLDKGFRRSAPMLREEWQRCLGSLLLQDRLDWTGVRGGAAEARVTLLGAGPPFLGLQGLPGLSAKDQAAVLAAFQRNRDPGDRALMLRVMASWPQLVPETSAEGASAQGAAVGGVSALEDSAGGAAAGGGRPPGGEFLQAARSTLREAAEAWRHRRLANPGELVAIQESVVQYQHHAAVPLLIDALEAALAGPPSRWGRELAATLMALTGRQFGDRAATWRRWWAAEGQEWLQKARAGRGPGSLDQGGAATPGDAGTGDPDAPAAGHTVGARFFGLPVDAQRLCIVVDGSGSMRQPLDHRSCAVAAADELEDFLGALPKSTLFNLWIIGRNGSVCFPECQPATRSNRRRAVSMVRGYGFGSSSSMYDVLVEAQRVDTIDTMVFLSDGGGSWGSFAFPSHTLDGLAQEYLRSGVRVHTIGVGATGVRREFMQELARLTGGNFLEIRKGKRETASDQPSGGSVRFVDNQGKTLGSKAWGGEWRTGLGKRWPKSHL